MSRGAVKKTGWFIQRQRPGHAMEFVADINGTVYINDSASITIKASWNSLYSCGGNIIFIMEATDSGNDYSALEELVKEKVKIIIGLGDNSAIEKGLSKSGKKIKAAGSVQEAVKIAAAIAQAGDTVLFSPTCPSYHPFDNYKNRGNDFKRAVKSLTEKK